MICSKCGKKVDDDAVFCPNCGERAREKPPTNVDVAIELSKEEIKKRNKDAFLWLTLLLVTGFLVFLLGFLLLGFSVYLILMVIAWLLTFFITYSTFKRLPITQKDADEHDKKVIAKYAPKPAPQVQIMGDISKLNVTSRFGLWSVMQKGAKKYYAISAYIAGLFFGVIGALLPMVGLGGFANVPSGIYVQDQQLSGQVGISAYKFEDGVFYYTDYYTYGSSSAWGAPRNYTCRAGRVAFKYTINWGGGDIQTVEGKIYVLNFGNTLSADFFGFGEKTYTRE